MFKKLKYSLKIAFYKYKLKKELGKQAIFHGVSLRMLGSATAAARRTPSVKYGRSALERGAVSLMKGKEEKRTLSERWGECGREGNVIWVLKADMNDDEKEERWVVGS